jgi:hypothetical protein
MGKRSAPSFLPFSMISIPSHCEGSYPADPSPGPSTDNLTDPLIVDLVTEDDQLHDFEIFH